VNRVDWRFIPAKLLLVIGVLLIVVLPGVIP